MNNRENYAALINHQPTEGVPDAMACMAMLGGNFETWENGPFEGGLDGFGNNWIPTESAGGQPALDPNTIPLDDVCDWEDKVRFPDLDAIDWESYAAGLLANVDRENQFVEYHTWNSVFLRFTHLLGFEDGLCAFLEEPDASKALCDAIADYKISLLERVAKYIKPDAYVHYDDVATDRSLFMSADVYREFIKPAHTRMNDAARALNIIPEIHICGCCEEIIPDIIEEGSVAWQSAQPMNDIPGIIEKYGDRLAVIGGYDSNGAPGANDVSDETIIAEIDRCIDEYGKYGHSFAVFGLPGLGSFADPNYMRKFGVISGRIAERNAQALAGANA